MLESKENPTLSNEFIIDEIQKTIEGVTTQFSSTALTKVIQYHFNSGGKQIRAKLAYLLAVELGTKHKNAITWASVCEILHNASLIHDDLQDQDQFRRNQESVWKKFGAHTAITSGDFLIFLSMQLVQELETTASIKVALMNLITNTSLKLANGQFNEQSLKHLSVEKIWEHYLKTVDEKTSSLFELPLVGAGILSSSNCQKLSQLKDLSSDFGQLFQVQDDVIDLFGNKGRKGIGNDIKEGKLSALCAKHIVLHPDDHQFLLETLKLQRDKTTDEIINKIKLKFKNEGSLKNCTDFIQQKLNDIENNDLLKTNNRLSVYFKEILKILVKNFNEVNP